MFASFSSRPQGRSYRIVITILFPDIIYQNYFLRSIIKMAALRDSKEEAAEGRKQIPVTPLENSFLSI
jgi:hypothetical protein